jgi:hypothetical protein
MTLCFIPMKARWPQPTNQPQPRIPGLSRRMVRMHAERLFRDVFPGQPLTEREWRLVEEDFARKLESDGFEQRS